MMAKRYELSDEALTVVADLFTETHGRGRSGSLWPVVNGLSTISGLANPGSI